ncbi:MAG: coenzyme-B sulfoethylthiotransferase subunit beta [Thermoproteota archaeon]|jgi:methyl-coenzyme M reductase beta subunit|uniref:coenzyme-B sulfoethylthiotransferase n=1 Tax=Candidatus Methanodesulfokora washburnensis TaxID=2478471 RepID=A0A3R9PGH0_9CREN|nr:coenzyme-B sulfoethylthiotransferase subunit beta [Candidatus Methanodesulfokores washburnensis]RSN72835.1 coenzyme-B sulfoethylthiotransferase subunit beta [Candidatus Methanodesulfokores washburnensis]RZN63748.1 MAG: coenzyme-B sulfoethylthiotransferase subunit beta [Candidatus Methanodesulfokores washburnensis]TDA40882.1 MAG: coenzyme-B sulfoethylthiotransferase subunit beta [Candidatus Korarchaeota archaeon]
MKEDKIDLYDDRGRLVESDVPLRAVHPLLNPAIIEIKMTIARSVAVDLEGMQRALERGAVGGSKCVIPGKSLKLDLVGNAHAIADGIKKIVQVKKDDDTEVQVLENGKSLLVKVPTIRVLNSIEYTAPITATAAALTETIINLFNLDMFQAPMVKAAVWGRYPQTMNLMGAYIKSLLSVPQENEGLGYVMRNIPVSYITVITRRNAINAAALAGILEQSAMVEMGDAVGSFERLHLLGLAFQALNANNLVYELVKENGKNGSVGTVVASLVKRAIEDGVIEPNGTSKSGYRTYKAKDMALWNAYAAAGYLAATMVNCGAQRAMQSVSAVSVYYNDLLERQVGLPAVDFGRVQGTGVEFSFFSHSIYGGGSPVVFHGNHIVTRHSKGFVAPCIAAAIALDAGTVHYTPEAIAGVLGRTFSTIPVLREPIVHVAKAAASIKGAV